MRGSILRGGRYFLFFDTNSKISETARVDSRIPEKYSRVEGTY